VTLPFHAGNAGSNPAGVTTIPDSGGFYEDENRPPGECANHVMRSGSWCCNPNFMMSATRIKVFWGVQAFLHCGIRLVRELD